MIAPEPHPRQISDLTAIEVSWMIDAHARLLQAEHTGRPPAIHAARQALAELRSALALAPIETDN